MRHAASSTYPGMPPESGLPVPSQDLRRAPAENRRLSASPRVNAARMLAFGGALLLGGFGTYEMIQVVSAGGTTVIEAAVVVLFAVTFTWIAFAATSALAGFLLAEPRQLPHVTGPLRTRTALVMPVYNEDAQSVTAALRVMGRGLAELGHRDAFEIVVLSDSNSADAWVAETTAVDDLKRALQGLVPVWYRRRWDNAGKKAGNIREFIERWGGRYDHLIVLDADSVMQPSTLVALVAAMEADDTLGILQTTPVLAGGHTLFQRLQQFASRVYGPVVANGVAAWQGEEGNYWGHNAIIRTAAFAQCCGLPVLRGREPFGGPILSHDFVEAALMRRAGWAVRLVPDVEGSWEECPPSLIDVAVRDRRWAQGNLQHLKVIGAKGLAWPSRLHFAIGIMSYCASPLWLLLILSGFALALQAHFIKPEYFSDTFQLFPTWPMLDAERMLRLFAFTMLVLLVPKLLGVVRALALPELRRGCGGAGRVLASAATELLLSALYAPIMMLVHTRHVIEIVAGKTIGWSTQRRSASGTAWAEAARRHAGHTVGGLAMAALAWVLSPVVLAWLAPTLAGLLLAIPLSLASGSTSLGLRLRRRGLLVTPEESRPPRIFRDRIATIGSAAPLPEDGLLALVTRPSVREAHFHWAAAAPHRRGAPEGAQLTAAEKLAEAESLAEALSWLDTRERLHVAGNSAMLERMMRLSHANTDVPPPTQGSGNKSVMDAA